MKRIKEKYRSLYEEELWELLHRRAFAILWIGAILIPVFSLLDYVVVREHFTTFLNWRVGVFLFFLFSIFCNLSDKQHKYALFIVTAGFIVVSAMISAMIVSMGGYSSVYYVGLILSFIAYTVIFPLTVQQTVSAGIFLFAVYAIPILLFNIPDKDNVVIFFTNCSFFITFLCIIFIRSSAEEKARQNEFNLRMEEKEIHSQLSFYIDKLEHDVKKRTKELQDSENHFRDLYENIIDDVILVDRQGKILLANQLFYKKLHLSENTEKDIPLLDVVHPQDVSSAKNDLLGILQQGDNVSDFQCRLKGKDETIIDVECNATIIQKESFLVGFQILIRDISTHKQINEELLKSFKTIQQTRNATILGLAKLSEYRDVNSGNHLEKIREYSLAIARQMATKKQFTDIITEQFIEDLYHSSILYDIGKVGVSDKILFKTGPLSDAEREHIRQHTTHGGNILKAVDAETEGQSFLSMAKNIAYFHHEKWDGSGYPYGFRQDETPLAARIVSLADRYDELTTTEKYGNPNLHQEAMEIIIKEKNRTFDPDIVDAFLVQSQLFAEIRKKYSMDTAQNDTNYDSLCYRTHNIINTTSDPDFNTT